MTVAVREWWRDAVVYEVYVRSFADSDGDGTGDLEGVRQRLPHLVELGVDALWLTPFYVSPMADGGYDVADPCDVDPLFGDLAAFDRLLADAHAAGLRVVVDVVPNHTSRAHPWFVAALADPASPMRERYVFAPSGPDGGPPNNWRSVFGGPAWTQVDGRDEWYLHLFDASQPDLDWHCPAVHDALRDVLRFWLDRGVDGFRIDVAHSLYTPADLADAPGSGSPGADTVAGRDGDATYALWDQPEVLAVYEDWRRLLDSYDGDRTMVGEVFLFDVARIARYVGDTRLHAAFNFTVMAAPWGAAALRPVLEAALADFDPPTWVLSNHDLVRHVTRYGGGDLGRRRGLAVTALLLALPGSPYLYQGEELGLDEADVPEGRRQDPIWSRTGEAGRDGCRTPLPWRAGVPGLGFTTGEPWLPFGAGAERLAADVQAADPSSVLSTYRRLLRARRELLPSLGQGLAFADAPEDVLVVRREGGLVAVLNTAAEDVELELAGELVVATAEGASAADGVVSVPAASTVWLRG